MVLKPCPREQGKAVKDLGTRWVYGFSRLERVSEGRGVKRVVCREITAGLYH